MAKVYTVQKARKDQGSCIRGDGLIKKGDSYQWTQASRFSPKLKKHTKCAPFTQAETTYDMTLGALYDARDTAHRGIDDWGKDHNGVVPDTADLQTVLDDLLSEVETAKGEWEERLGNIPDGLREGGTAGQSLQEKYDAADSYESELQSVDFEEFELEDAIGQATTEWDEETGKPVAHDGDHVATIMEAWIEEQRDLARGAVDSFEY